MNRDILDMFVLLDVEFNCLGTSIGLARNFVWGGPNRAAYKFYKLYTYIIIDIYIYRWRGLTPTPRVHVCHNRYRAILCKKRRAAAGELYISQEG